MITRHSVGSAAENKSKFHQGSNAGREFWARERFSRNPRENKTKVRFSPSSFLFFHQFPAQVHPHHIWFSLPRCERASLPLALIPRLVILEGEPRSPKFSSHSIALFFLSLGGGSFVGMKYLLLESNGSIHREKLIFACVSGNSKSDFF